MPKRSSAVQHSKVIERRVMRYLWGPEAARDWKEQHDVSGLDLNDCQWVGEVKDYSADTILQRGGVLRVARAALEQAERTPAGAVARCFGWVHTKRRALTEDCVAFRQAGVVYYCTGATFAERFGRVAREISDCADEGEADLPANATERPVARICGAPGR